MFNTGEAFYQAAAANDVIVRSERCILRRILVGADVASAVIEISDHASNGDGNIVAKYSGSTLMTSTKGSIECDLELKVGMTVDIANQTDLTFITEPI